MENTGDVLARLSGVAVALVGAAFIALTSGQLNLALSSGYLSFWGSAVLVGVVAAAVPWRTVRLVAHGLVALVLVPLAGYFLVGLLVAVGSDGSSAVPFVEIALMALGATAGVTGLVSTLRQG